MSEIGLGASVHVPFITPGLPPATDGVLTVDSAETLTESEHDSTT